MQVILSLLRWAKARISSSVVCSETDLVGGGDLVQHHLESVQIRQGLAAGEDKITIRRDGVHPADALADLLRRETRQIRILSFIDAERAMVLTIIGDEDCHRGAALPRLVGMIHVDRPFVMIYRQNW